MKFLYILISVLAITIQLHADELVVSDQTHLYIDLRGKIVALSDDRLFLELSDHEINRLSSLCESLQHNVIQVISIESKRFANFLNQEVIVILDGRKLITNNFGSTTIEAKEEFMELSEEAIDFLEDQIPELAGIAIRQAYWNALASGFNVLVSKNGALVEVHPDGTEKIIKELPLGMPVVRGQKIKLR